MDIFEYLPQLIVAYDGNDEFANLIHVKKADRDKDYYCPCCGGIVKPRALDSNKEQSHYYHKTGKCTKENQLHFFCKNWLFEIGSKFYIEDELFEVFSIEIEKNYVTQFGDYRPDITVHTTNGKTVFFEMFFTNRKTGDDYFCKWNALGNDVVEVNIKEYMCKTDTDIIPSFTYLYHDGICYSKTYVKRDLYANTIARIKHELTRQKVLNYKARIEQLDWFWQQIRNNTRESILDIVSKMEYEDMVSCYDIIKRKQCVSYLKDDILSLINQKVISDVRESLDLPYDENIYFDLKHVRGRTYEAGIRLNIKTDHITYDNFVQHCYYPDVWEFDKLKKYPKIVFNKNLHNIDEIIIPEDRIDELKKIYEDTVEYKKKLVEFENDLSVFEGSNDYKVRVKNKSYTVLAKTETDGFRVVLEDFYIEKPDINILSREIEYEIKKTKDKEYLDIISKSEKYQSMIFELKNYKKEIDYHVDVKYHNSYYSAKNGIYLELFFHNRCVYSEMLQPTIEDFINKIDNCKKIIDDFVDSHQIIIDLVKKINTCKNNFWNAELSFNSGYIRIKINQKLFEVKKYYLQTYEMIYLDDSEILTEQQIKSRIKKAMLAVLKNMERCGYRVMEVCN